LHCENCTTRTAALLERKRKVEGPMRMPVVSESYQNYQNDAVSNKWTDGRWKEEEWVLGMTVILLMC
jgi:hypothetical protein